MSKIIFLSRSYERLDDESVLRCLLRNGVRVPYSCESGACQSCVLRAIKGQPPSNSQEDLKETQKALGHFKSCVCKPEEALEVVMLDDADHHKYQMEVVERSFLNDEILRLRLRSDEQFEYRAGQFINIFKGELIRSYSLASLPAHDDLLELHIKRVPGGKVSNWLCGDIQPGDQLTVTGPMGECFFHDANSEGILAVGTGSGLAPLWGIVRDAIAQGYDRPIILCHGGEKPENLYYVDELSQLAERHENFSYFPCLSGLDKSNLPAGMLVGFPNDVALAQRSSLAKWQIFLCGHPDMVNNTKRKAYLAGASLQDIHADPFVLASSH